MKSRGLFLRFDTEFGAVVFVCFSDFADVALHFDDAVFEVDGLLAESQYLAHAVRHYDEGGAVFLELVYFFGAFFAEGYVAHAEHLVDEHYIGIDVYGYREAQSRDHTGGIVFKGNVHEFAELREFHYAVVFTEHFAVRESHHRAVQEYVFLACGVHVEARAQLEKGDDIAFGEGDTLGGANDAGDYFEQGGFTRAVTSDEGETFAAIYAEIDVFQDLELLVADLAFDEFYREFLDIVDAFGGHRKLHTHVSDVHEKVGGISEGLDGVRVKGISCRHGAPLLNMQNEFITGEAEYYPTHEEGAYTYAVDDGVRFPTGDIAHNDVSEVIEVMQKGIELHYVHCGFVEFERGKGVEYRREVHPQPCKNSVDMFNIPEADVYGCEEEAYSRREKEDRGEPREEDHQH